MKKALLVLAVAVPFVLIGTVGVWQLSGDNNRRLGAIGATDEPVALSWRGPWDAEAKYAAGQVVSYRGVSYVAERDNGGSQPHADCAEECTWAVMAVSGAQGPKGDQGPPGQPGAKGEPGTGGTITIQNLAATRTATGGDWQQQTNPYYWRATLHLDCPTGYKALDGSHSGVTNTTIIQAGVKADNSGFFVLIEKVTNSWTVPDDRSSQLKVRCISVL